MIFEILTVVIKVYLPTGVIEKRTTCPSEDMEWVAQEFSEVNGNVTVEIYHNNKLMVTHPEKK